MRGLKEGLVWDQFVAPETTAVWRKDWRRQRLMQEAIGAGRSWSYRVRMVAVGMDGRADLGSCHPMDTKLSG